MRFFLKLIFTKKYFRSIRLCYSCFALRYIAYMYCFIYYFQSRYIFIGKNHFALIFCLNNKTSFFSLSLPPSPFYFFSFQIFNYLLLSQVYTNQRDRKIDRLSSVVRIDIDCRINFD